ncbi:MAG TPA: hypothetical protein V6C52_04525 [Coleofasciculaceae cyanobacterium]|jgi:hypothetical protein
MLFAAMTIFIRRSGFIVLLAGLLALGGCRSDHISVNPKDPKSPQFAYRLDELALLQMAADDIMDLERKKQYGRIYDDYASHGFKRMVSRRHFLIMSNCVETHLGALQEFDINEIGFRREVLKEQPGTPLEVLNRRATRAKGTIDEQMVFIGDGVNFKLNGLYWIAKDKQFLECIRNSPEMEANTRPPEEIQPVAGQPPLGTTPPTQPGEPASTGKPGEPATASEPAPDGQTAPVQQMAPSEVGQKTIQARPAGAGAVEDTRPAQTPKKKSTRSAEQSGQTGGSPATPLEPVQPMPELQPTPAHNNNEHPDD